MTIHTHRELTCDFDRPTPMSDQVCWNTYDGAPNHLSSEVRAEAKKFNGWVRVDGHDYCHKHDPEGPS